MKNKSPSQLVLICLLAAAVFALCNSSARADRTTWTGRGNDNDWFNCRNWDPDCPDVNTDAFINNGAKVAINHSGAVAQSLTLGENVGDSGTLTVDGTAG